MSLAGGEAVCGLGAGISATAVTSAALRRRAAIFMDGALGTAMVGYKIDGQVTWRNVFNASAPVLPGFAAKKAFTL